MTQDIARLIVDQAPDAIIFAGPDGTVQEWNAGAEQVFGFTRDEAMGQNLDLIIPERFREAHWAAFNAALANGKTRLNGKALPTRSMRKDGATIYVELSFGVIVGSDGASLGALAIARDITEKFLAERAKREAEKAG
jgi:PAS domain S-box-containing protein